MKVLLTGAAGFIGSHLAEALVRRGDDVVGLDNLDDFYDPAIKRGNLRLLEDRPGFRFVKGDIRDRDALTGILDGFPADTLVHLAALAGVRPSIEHPAAYAEVNVAGTALLLEEAVRSGISRVVFASSSSVYGERSDPPFREDDRVDHPVSPYAATKKAGELICHALHRTRGVDVAVLRYFTVYGPRQRPEMAIHRFCRRIEAERPIPVFGDGTSARDYTYVDDIVAGTVSAIDRCEGYRIYNLGGAATTTLAELLEILSDALNREVRVDRRPIQAGDVSLTSAGIDRAARELSYRPEVALREGVSRFVTWLRGEAR